MDSNNNIPKRIGNPNWVKGQSGNPNGRPVGTKNRTTEEIRNFLKAVMDDNLPRLQSDLDQMSPFNRWQTIDKLSRSFLPSLTQSDINSIVNGEVKITVKYKEEDNNIEDIETLDE